MSEVALLREINELRRRLAYLESSNLVSASSGTWLPTYGGFSSGPPATHHRYYLLGKLCVAMIEPTSTGTSNATNYTITGPFTAATVTNGYWRTSVHYVYDNGSLLAQTGAAVIASASNVINVYASDNNGAVWTASGAKLARFTLIYEVA